MKKVFSLFLCVIFIMTFAVTSLGLTSIAVKSIKVDKSNITLKVGETYTLKATITPDKANKNLTYSSSNKSIATVDKNGKIKVIKVGKAVITVTSSSNSKAVVKCNVTVSPDKYSPAIELSTVRITDSTWNYADGDSIDNNPWTRLYMDSLGIKVKNLWVADVSQAEQKVNLAIASGDIPDILKVDGKQLKMLYEAGVIADLTDAFNKYAAPFTREIMTQDGGFNMESASFKGKLMALPITDSVLDGSQVLWIRMDWLKKLKLSEPKTVYDIINIARAFAKQDPDGDGKQNTIGLSIVNEVCPSAFAGAEGFFYGFNTYPETWYKNKSGNIVYGSVQPEVKAVLQKLQDLYKEEVLDKEFGVKDWTKVCEDVIAGKTGLMYGTMANPAYPFRQLQEKDPKSDWKAFPVLSVGGDAGVVVRPRVGIQGYYIVNKDTKHPEAAVKMLNLWIEKFWGATAEPNTYGENPNGIHVQKYAVLQAWPAYKNYNILTKVRDAFKTNNLSKLDPEQKNVYDLLDKYKKGDLTQWFAERIFGKDSSYLVIDKYVTENRYIYNEFYGIPTPTMQSKGATLRKMQVEAYTKIIMNAATADEFDSFVSKWKSLGGNEMTKEVNNWYKSIRK